jgi:hypothetical protein
MLGHNIDGQLNICVMPALFSLWYGSEMLQIMNSVVLNGTGTMPRCHLWTMICDLNFLAV